jgi:hypothetical protein
MQMKKFFAGAFACLALWNTAQAAIYTFEYTALVSKIEVGKPNNDNIRTPVTASNLAGGTISVGNKVTGIISYDSNAPISSISTHYDGSTSVSYGYFASLDLTAHFLAADVNFASNGYKWGYMSYGGVPTWGVNGVSAGTYRYLTLPDGAMTREVLAVDLGDSTSTKIGNKLPGVEAVDFDSNSMSYEFDNQHGEVLRVEWNIAEMKFLQAAPVPEPETYAMLLAGLAVIGWNRRRKAATV